MKYNEFESVSYYVAILLGLMLFLKWGLVSVNIWIYEGRLGKKTRECLPPGDLGWPFIGNMWSFLRAFKSSDPDSFISNFVCRYRYRGIYKSFMFGNPSIIVTVPKAYRKILFDDDAFKPGWPIATVEIVGKLSFLGISAEAHKRLRKLTTTPINGPEALSTYMKYKRLMCSESEHIMEDLEEMYTTLNHGLRAMAINVPGFVYYKALKARKKLVTILLEIVCERRKKREATQGTSKKNMLDALLDTQDEDGKKLDSEQIVNLLIMYLNAGHESLAHTTMWSTMFLQGHPECLQTAKKEQERIAKNMPPGQKGLTLKEFRQMEYLSKVIDETLRLINIAFTTFREAKKDVDIEGYIIPKGWKVILWFRGVHLNPKIYPQPKEFNPSRWDDLVPKVGTFLPFGAGTRLCPGNELAKLEIAIFLHHYLLNYEFKKENPKCPLITLPHPRPKDNCLGKLVKVSK